MRTKTLDWGSRKSAYYSGDVADLEIGQDEADAFDEEKAAKEIERVRYQDLGEGDFFSDSDGGSDNDEDEEKINTFHSKKETLALPSTSRKKASLSNQDKLKLLKKTHPTVASLLPHFSSQASSLLKLIPLEETIRKEGDMVGATKDGKEFVRLRRIGSEAAVLNAVLMLLLQAERAKAGAVEGRGAIESHPVVEMLGNLTEFEGKLEKEVAEPHNLGAQLEKVQRAIEIMKEGFGSDNDSDDESSEEMSGDEISDEGFDSGLDDQSLDDEDKEKDDEGDEDEDDKNIKKALAMMEADGIFDHGSSSENDNVHDNDDISDDGEDDRQSDLDEDDVPDDFYESQAAKSSLKRNIKKTQHAVAPKFPTVEGTVEGERAAGYKIMKNRGLVAHKAKINRNPRVKKREQYRKALIRRKGAIREVRSGAERDQYEGEKTGIKQGVSRSRKIK